MFLIAANAAKIAFQLLDIHRGDIAENAPLLDDIAYLHNGIVIVLVLAEYRYGDRIYRQEAERAQQYRRGIYRGAEKLPEQRPPR